MGGAREAELKAGPLIIEEAAHEHNRETLERDFKGERQLNMALPLVVVVVGVSRESISSSSESSESISSLACNEGGLTLTNKNTRFQILGICGFIQTHLVS